MSALELLLKENTKTLAFGQWLLKKGPFLTYKYDTNIYSILAMLGDKEITFYMSNGLIFEVQFVNNIIIFSGQSVHNKAISLDYPSYEWID